MSLSISSVRRAIKVGLAQCIIAPIRLFTPFMFVIFLRSMLGMTNYKKRGYIRGFIQFWAKVEVIFWLWSMNKRRKLNAIPVCMPTLSAAQRSEYLKQVFETADMIFRGGAKSKKVQPLKTIQSIAYLGQFSSPKGPMSGPNLLQISLTGGSGMSIATPQGARSTRVMSMENIFRYNEEASLRETERSSSSSSSPRRTSMPRLTDGDEGSTTLPDEGREENEDWSDESGEASHDKRFLAFKRADFCSWFGIDDPNLLYRGNIEEWVKHYSVLPLPPHKLTEDEQRQVHKYTDEVISFLELKPKKGYNKRIRPLMYISDPVQIHHRPFLQYVVVRCFQNVANYFWARKSCFTQYKSGIYSYWHRPALISTAKGEEEPLALVFVHGLGLGASTLFIPGFMKSCMDGLDGDRRQIIVLSFPHLQQKPGWEDHVPTTEETTATIKMIFAFHKVTQAHFIAHSLGTVIAAWFISRTNFVKCLTFVDPVCITLLRSDIIFDNLYKPPERFSEALLRFFVFRESTTAAVLCRNMYSLQNVFEFKNIKCPMLFMVGGADPIVPGYSVVRLLQYQKTLRETDPTLPHLEVLFEKSYNHGHFLLHGADVLPQIQAVDAAAHRVLRDSRATERPFETQLKS